MFLKYLLNKKHKDFSFNVICALKVKDDNHRMGLKSEDSDFKLIECQNYKNPYRSSSTSAGFTDEHREVKNSHYLNEAARAEFLSQFRRN